jgi:hypothetical protein
VVIGILPSFDRLLPVRALRSDRLARPLPPPTRTFYAARHDGSVSASMKKT